jgi:NitT/TauT family transport system substrate-binding protein
MHTSRFSQILLLVLTVVASGCGGGAGRTAGAGSDGRKTFNVATLTWVGYGPLYLAKEKGFFKGIDVSLRKIEDTAARRAALTTGDVQGSVDIVDSFANAFAAGVPARVVLRVDDSMGGDGIVVKKEITRVGDLKGRTVAYPPGQPSHFLLLTLLDEAGLTIKDVQSCPMEADQAGAAFFAGGVDAAVTWEPWLTKASKMTNARVLFTSREAPGLIVDVFTVRADYLEKNPEVVQAFLRGWFAAVDYWRANPEESDRIMAKALGLDPKDFKHMISGIRYADLEGNRAFFSRDSDGESPFTKLMGRANRIWSREGLIARPRDPKSADGSALVLGLKP